ncbi:MAG: hypothetical protein JWQ87_2410 [Candidatus Sulfotelmatobacter sp.]|nr:hypothetical protein [Candidatus Sulfotelmatobacter sp.]
MSESESKATFDPGNVRIAGKKTVRDWQQFRTKLIPGINPAIWAEAFRTYFHKRVATRYLKR